LPGVGQNLQDHLVVPVVYQCLRPVSMASVETLGNLLRYLLFKRGPLASNLAECGGFVKTQSHFDRPDLQFHCVAAHWVNHGFTQPAAHFFTIGPTQLRPQSRGSTTLQSTTPLEAPAIRPNYLANEMDLRVLVEGVRMCRKI